MTQTTSTYSANSYRGIILKLLALGILEALMKRAAKRQFVEVKPRIDLSPKEITTNVDRFFYR